MTNESIEYAVAYSSKTKSSVHPQASLVAAMSALDECPYPNGRIVARRIGDWEQVDVSVTLPNQLPKVADELTVRLAEMLYDDQTGTRGMFDTSVYRNSWVRRVGKVVKSLGSEERD